MTYVDEKGCHVKKDQDGSPLRGSPTAAPSPDEFSLAGDAFAFQPIKTCFYCGHLSQVLCDGILAVLRDKENPRVTARDAKIFTCDRPMCRACVAETGMMHINMKPKHIWDSRDYCRDCVKEERQYGGQRLHNGQQRPLNLVSLSEGLALQARRIFCVESSYWRAAPAASAEQDPQSPSTLVHP